MIAERYDLQGAEAPALLDREIDDLLLQARGLAVVRELLARQGASREELAAHGRELEATRERLAALIRGDEAGVPGPPG